MKELKLVIAIPSAGMVRMGFAYSLAGMVASLASRRVPTLPDCSIEIKLDVVESSNWITNREQLVKRALDAGMTHLLFLDDDMSFEPTILETLLGRRHDIVVTNYLIKTIPASDFVAVGLDGNRIPTLPSSTGILPIAYSGFGVSLFSTEVFKKVPQPWFIPEFIPSTSSYTTEDNPFYRKAREAGFTVYLDQDASKQVAHVGNKAWVWKEYSDG